MSLILEVSGLVKRFGGLLATDHLSLSLQRGEIHAVIGPNGAGKTTFINQLGGEILCDEGRIVFDGHDLTLEPPFRRAMVGDGRADAGRPGRARPPARVGAGPW
jgi:branched-chain amino acid transport system ATP-binding protein